MYAHSGCGLRSIIEILKIVDEVFGGVLGEIPSYNTIGNWVKKYGLDIYNSSGESLKGKKYAEVADESIMIGSEKLLVTIGVPSQHQGRPLRLDDLNILDMAVSSGWSGEKVKEQLDKTTQKVGHKPEYIISDNASVMKKGIRLSNIAHHCDISHTLGMYLERTYKEADDFKAYIRDMTSVKFKYIMKNTAYLLPPKQRVIARFMNLTDWVKWSRKMLDTYHTLSSEEKLVFSFIPSYASFIDELWDVTRCIQKMEYICKHEGLSKASILKCQSQIRNTIALGNSRMIKLACDILLFLEKEATLIKSDKDVHNNSSDIIESVFGAYKARKSPNKLYGITPFVLFIPAQTQLRKNKNRKKLLFKEPLERVRLKDIHLWATENLSLNLVRKRTETLSRAS